MSWPGGMQQHTFGNDPFSSFVQHGKRELAQAACSSTHLVVTSTKVWTTLSCQAACSSSHLLLSRLSFGILASTPKCFSDASALLNETEQFGDDLVIARRRCL